MQQKTLVIAVITTLLAGGGVLYYFSGGSFLPGKTLSSQPPQKPKVIEETLTLPDTTHIVSGAGRTIEEGKVDVPLVPKNEGERIIVSKAVLTVKNGYDLAAAEAQKWADDAKLVFVKSLGAVTLEGKSSQWQIAFASMAKKKGYEVVIQGDQIASHKEVASDAVGAAVPENLIDSSAAIQAIQEMPQFSDATVSSINLYYNADGKVWRYAFATSIGTTSLSAQ